MRQVSFEQRNAVSRAGETMPRVRSTLDFASLDDHMRMPARFFGRLIASGAASLTG